MSNCSGRATSTRVPRRKLDSRSNIKAEPSFKKEEKDDE